MVIMVDTMFQQKSKVYPDNFLLDENSNKTTYERQFSHSLWKYTTVLTSRKADASTERICHLKYRCQRIRTKKNFSLNF